MKSNFGDHSEKIETPRRSHETVTTIEEISPEKGQDVETSCENFLLNIRMPSGILKLMTLDTDHSRNRVIIARNISRLQFSEFMELNDFPLPFYWSYGNIYMKDVDSGLYDSNETNIHSSCVAYFGKVFNVWSNRIDAPNVPDLSSRVNGQTSGQNAVMQPDVVYTLDDEDRVVIEVCYSTHFEEAHNRMINEFNTIATIKAGIIIKIAYPIDNEQEEAFPDGVKYSMNDGSYVAIFYERPINIEALRPVRVVSFGDTALPDRFRTQITRFTGLHIIGYLERDINTCSATGIQDFIYAFPARALLVRNEDDQQAITGHAANQIPDNNHLVIDLFDVKLSIRRGISLANREVRGGAATVVRTHPTLL